MQLDSIRYCVSAAIAISVIACGAKSDGPTPPAAAQILSDAFSGTAVDVSKWTIVSGATLLSIDPSEGAPAPSLLFEGGNMQAVQTINTTPGYTLSFDIAHSAGTGNVLVWAKRVQGGTPVSHDSQARFSYFGGGTTPSVQFQCVGGNSPNVPFTDDALFHHFVLTVAATGECSWTRDGVVLYSVPPGNSNLGLYNLSISGSGTGMMVHIDNLIVTSP